MRGMRESDWPAVSALIETEWEANHPVLAKDFFFWQHRGFGTAHGLSATALAFKDGTLIGMRGVIPGEYQVPQGDGSYQYVSGGAFAMWIVAKDMRGRGVGKQLLAYCESHLPVMVALGSNEKTSVPIYLKSGFSRLSGLHHWFALLSREASSLLIGPPQPVNLLGMTDPPNRCVIEETSDVDLLGALWENFSHENSILSLRRTAEFWRWRYLDHPVFNYQILYAAALDTFAVVRVEEVRSDGDVIRVLRIVELVVGKQGENATTMSEAVTEFLQTLILEKLEAGVAAIDFRVSNEIFDEAMSQSGFSLMAFGELRTGFPGFAGQLNPLRLRPSPINLHWKTAKGLAGGGSVPHFTKSDSDMDRPNVRGVRSKKL